MVTADPNHPGRALFYPIDLSSLRGEKASLPAASLPPHGNIKVKGVAGNQLDIEASFTAPATKDALFGIVVFAAPTTASKPASNSTSAPMAAAVAAQAAPGKPYHEFIGLDINIQINASAPGWATLAVGPHLGPFPMPKTGKFDLRVLVDRSVVEVFVNGGTAAITHRIYPGSTAAAGVYVVNHGSDAIALTSLDAYTVANATAPSIEELRQQLKD